MSDRLTYISEERQIVFFAGALQPGMGTGRVEVCSHTVKPTVRMPVVMHRKVANFNRAKNSTPLAGRPGCFFTNPSCLCGEHRKPHKSHKGLLQSLKQSQPSRHRNHWKGHVVAVTFPISRQLDQCFTQSIVLATRLGCCMVELSIPCRNAHQW